mmetsp:Transcript_43517/g.38741  ORF Transcript_43517/g.38741 Transcript_43517/m.38741 type:complete len:415 (+) Transcript_43517:71-1315(+)
MDIREELTSLNHWIYCWFVSITIIWLLSFIWLWQFSLSCLLFVIPFCVFIRWWNKNRMFCSLNHAIQAFLHGFINIPILSIIAQGVGLFIITAFFLVTQLITFAFGSFLWILIAITYYVAIEEALKLYFSLKTRDNVQDPINQITKKDTITSTATSLGYSITTGVLWTILVAVNLNKDDIKDNDQYSLFGWLFLVTLIIAVIGMPMQLITGYVMGCKITQKDIECNENNEEFGRSSFKHYINVIYFSIFVRSTYLFFLVVGFLVMNFNIFGVIIAVFGIIIDYILLIKYAKKIESSLPFDYLRRAGQLSIFGYNILNDYEYDQQPNINGIDNNNNNNDHVQITTMALDNFSADLDEPMIIGSNNNDKDPEMQYKRCDLDDNEDNEEVEIHVRDEILDEDEASSDHDTNSNSTVR